MNGSSRDPKREVVRRTPLATARTRPELRVRSVMIAVRLTQLLGAQHDRLVTVKTHGSIVPRTRSGVAQAGP